MTALQNNDNGLTKPLTPAAWGAVGVEKGPISMENIPQNSSSVQPSAHPPSPSVASADGHDDLLAELRALLAEGTPADLCGLASMQLSLAQTLVREGLEHYRQGGRQLLRGAGHLRQAAEAMELAGAPEDQVALCRLQATKIMSLMTLLEQIIPETEVRDV